MASDDETAQRGKARTREATTKPTAAPAEERPAPDATHEYRHLTVNLPMVTMDIRVPQAPHVDIAGTAKSVRDALPPPAEVAYFAGLGLLGVLNVIEWPVVLAVGAGTAIAQRVARHQRQPESAASTSSGA